MGRILESPEGGGSALDIINDQITFLASTGGSEGSFTHSGRTYLRVTKKLGHQ